MHLLVVCVYCYAHTLRVSKCSFLWTAQSPIVQAKTMQRTLWC